MVNENIQRMAEETRTLAAEILGRLEQKALELGLDKDPNLWFSFTMNTICMTMGAELECELRQMTYGSLLERMDEETYNAIIDNAKKVSKFGFEEIVAKRHPGAIRIVIDPEEKKP